MFETDLIKNNKRSYYFKGKSNLRRTTPTSVTSYFNIDPNEFEKTGAFDAVLNVDARLFVDPFLLPYTSTPELKKGRKQVLHHFQGVLTLLSNTKSQKDKTWWAAAKKLHFPEAKGFNFGYGKLNSSGSGMGSQFTRQLLETAFEIVQKGIKDPVIFELVGLFEEGIGCDRISDMVCRILYPEFMSFSQRLFKQFKVNTRPIKYKDKYFYLPINPFRKEPIILVPRDVLRDLPVATHWSDIDHICATNRKLRDRLSLIIGLDWKNKTKNWKKGDLKKFLLKNPELLTDLIQSYNNSTPQFYNYKEDPSGEANWLSLARKFTSENPLNLEMPTRDHNLNKLMEIVNKIIQKFGQLIEYNGLNEFLFKDDGSPKKEQAAQLLFYAVANIYCESNDLTIARESNAGRGPVDFKIANGKISVVVDLKLSSNTRLKHAYEKQIPIYQKAEGSSHATILVLKVKEKNESLEKLLKIKETDQKAGKHTPEIICFDATVQPSASRA